MEKDKGYLICNNCFGYYKLKENESPDDFKGCECGSPLVYRENLDNLKTNNTNSYLKNDSSFNEPEYNSAVDSNNEISDVLGSKSKDHEKYLEKLQETVLNQDVVQNYIDEAQMLDHRYDKLPVWDLNEEKRIKNEFDTQNIMINDIIEKEKLFQSYIKNKRETESLKYSYSHLKIGFIVLLIAFLALIVIYAIK